VLVALLVVLLFAAIVFPIYFRAQRRTFEDADLRQVRKVYLAWSLYQGDFNGQPAPSLLALGSRLESDAVLRSELDPFQGDGPFPVEPMLPEIEVTSNVRVSYAYLPNFVRNGRVSVRSWDEYLLDPQAGLMASVWRPGMTPSALPFRSPVSGPILRLFTDGSVRMVPTKGEVYGDPKALFGGR
jgi:hypothetical protein